MLTIWKSYIFPCVGACTRACVYVCWPSIALYANLHKVSAHDRSFSQVTTRRFYQMSHDTPVPRWNDIQAFEFFFSFYFYVVLLQTTATCKQCPCFAKYFSPFFFFKLNSSTAFYLILYVSTWQHGKHEPQSPFPDLTPILRTFFFFKNPNSFIDCL